MMQAAAPAASKIRVGGENVSGAEVEAVLLEHAAIKQAAAVPAPDPRLGEVVIAFVELLYSVQQIYDVTYQTIPLLIVAAIWYLIVTSVLYVGQYFIERRFGRGFSRQQQVGLVDRWFGFRFRHVQ